MVDDLTVVAAPAQDTDAGSQLCAAALTQRLLVR